MNTHFTVFSSNRVEVLLEELKHSLFNHFNHPFARRLIVVPSPAMESFVKLQFAKDYGIAAGLEFHKIEQSIGAICNILGETIPEIKDAITPTDLELSLLFESFIKNGIGKQRWKSLSEYLYANGEKRLIPLSAQLATLFNQYGKYGCNMLQEWEKGEISHWQADLWHEIKQTHPQLLFPYQKIDFIEKHLQDNSSSLANWQIHLFAVSFLPRKAHHFFEQLSHYIPVHFYWLSPCQLFWSDVRSDRENVKIQKMWKLKGVTAGQQNSLEEYLSNRNALLANFGRMGREMAFQFENSEADIKNSCVIPQTISHLPHYDELITNDVQLRNDIKFSMLDAVQSDMALLRNPSTSPKIDFPQDDSIQVHIGHTKTREVEILYNTLLHILTKSASSLNPIAPGEIIVMAPDIREYEPMVKSVFGDENSLLDFHLMDINVSSKSSIVKGFLHLLSLSEGRWEADQVYALLEYPAFQTKMGITGEEVQQIREWIQDSGVKWGLHPHHRKDILRQDHSQRSPVDESPIGTWDHSLGRLLMGVAIEPRGLHEEAHLSCFPVEGIETSQTTLLNKWLKLIHSLQKDLQPLSDGKKFTLQGWSKYLEYLKSEYFRINNKDKVEVDSEGVLQKNIQAIGLATRVLGDVPFSFQTIKHHLDKLLSNEPSAYRENHLHAVRFCSMLPMRALPAKVIVMMGMQEEVFPRQEIPFSLNELIGNQAADYHPTQRDFDRYLFLEALLSARQFFILSYVGYSFENNKINSPSIVIQELLNYLDDAYTVNYETVSSKCIIKHPFNAFDSSYFTSEIPYPSYIKNHFQLALKNRQVPKKDFHSFISDFSVQSPIHSSENEICISIKDLTSFASNPIKAYFNKTLGVYLDKSEQKEIKPDEPFALNALDKYSLKKQAVSSPYGTVFHQASQQGTVPQGMFKTIATQSLTREFDEIHSNLSCMGVNKQSLASLHFTDLCESPSFGSKGICMVPPIRIPYQDKIIKIAGILPDVSSEGLLVYSQKELKNLIKHWPSYLLLQHAINTYGLSIKPQMIFTQNDTPFSAIFEDPIKHLSAYLQVYFLGMKQMCPLIPEWAEDFTKSDPSSLSKQMEKMNDNFSRFYNDYAIWVFSDENGKSNATALHNQWNKIAQELFSEAVVNWK